MIWFSIFFCKEQDLRREEEREEERRKVVQKKRNKKPSFTMLLWSDKSE
jgi:hypothetical protein